MLRRPFIIGVIGVIVVLVALALNFLLTSEDAPQQAAPAAPTQQREAPPATASKAPSTALSTAPSTTAQTPAVPEQTPAPRTPTLRRGSGRTPTGDAVIAGRATPNCQGHCAGWRYRDRRDSGRSARRVGAAAAGAAAAGQPAN